MSPGLIANLTTTFKEGQAELDKTHNLSPICQRYADNVPQCCRLLPNNDYKMIEVTSRPFDRCHLENPQGDYKVYKLCLGGMSSVKNIFNTQAVLASVESCLAGGTGEPGVAGGAGTAAVGASQNMAATKDVANDAPPARAVSGPLFIIVTLALTALGNWS